MKICLLGDTHFGMRGDSIPFLDYGEKFYDETFFPYLVDNGINYIIQLGDFFDRRKYINFNSFKRTQEMFLRQLDRFGIHMYVLAGNHDTYHKNTNDINSLDILLKRYGNVTVIDEPETISFGYKYNSKLTQTSVSIIPWICADNYEKSFQEIKNTEAKICIGHFEIAGFAMHAGQTNHEGLDRKIFSKFDRVFSGHYHHKSIQDNIYYVGTPMEMTWLDYNDQKGFHIFDLETYDLEFIPNPNVMFHRIVYDDKLESITEIINKDLTKYTNTYVKVVVINKTNPFLFDQLMSKLYAVNPLDINIVEDHTDLTEGVEEDAVDQAEDTMTIIEKFVDSIKEEHINGDKLKTIMKEIYIEALNQEQV
jgi:DNA repair exonuclease SbcCD nuclease subunit